MRASRPLCAHSEYETRRLQLPRGVYVPVGDVLEPVVWLDRLVRADAVHALRHGVLVAARVKEDRGRRVGHLHLEVEVGGQARRRVDRGATVLQILVDQTPASRVREVE